ncbi:MAG: glycosyltransferase family 1 protein, partial [Dehalococcoidales bacterium]
MRIGFDMQALQSVNSIGGIGNYNRNLLSHLFEQYPDNKYELFFNSLHDSQKQPFVKSVNTRIHVVRYAAGNDLNPLNKWIQLAAYRSKPLDLLHVLSPFEPQTHTVISNKMSSKTVATIYDFIPYIFNDLYLTSPLSKKLYFDRLKSVKSARLLLSISEATRRDAIDLFRLSPDRIVNVGIAPSNDFQKTDSAMAGAIPDLKKRHGIEGAFVLTVSNLDHRKNLLTLLRTFSSLPNSFLKEFSLVVICNSNPEYVKRDSSVTEILSRKKAKIKFLYFISTDDLVALYNSCHLFVYASLYEGGGLPVMEAMKCGAPVVASNTSSIPEYVGRTDNLFDPRDQEDIMHSIVRVLSDEGLRTELGKYGEERSKSFSWDGVVKKTMQAYE